MGEIFYVKTARIPDSESKEVSTVVTSESNEIASESQPIGAAGQDLVYLGLELFEGVTAVPKEEVIVPADSEPKEVDQGAATMPCNEDSLSTPDPLLPSLPQNPPATSPVTILNSRTITRREALARPTRNETPGRGISFRYGDPPPCIGARSILGRPQANGMRRYQ